MCPENHVERGTPKGYTNAGLRTTETETNRSVPTQIDELTDKVNRKFCETLFDDEAISEQDLGSGSYKQRWRTFRLAVCGDCIKAGGAK